MYTYATGLSLCFFSLYIEENIFKVKKKRVSSELVEDMKHVKDSIDLIFSLTKDVKIPLALKKSLKETFKCIICMTMPIKPPVIISKCCKSIIGCEECINKWYCGPDALQIPCPHCRMERGYSDMKVLKGMDDFLMLIKKMQLEDCDESVVTDEAVHEEATL